MKIIAYQSDILIYSVRCHVQRSKNIWYFHAPIYYSIFVDAVVQNKRDKFCRESNYPCDADDTLYARIGPSFDSTEGLQLRCYCKVNVQHDKNVELITSNFYSKESTLITIF